MFTCKLRGLCSRYQALDFLDQFLSDLFSDDKFGLVASQADFHK
ncbi:hypothetical protein FDUTEX481_06643 [Tolypothrix sp. PCC 7601]|nr:hypothetical protein FDUTEX481_06643 [Tolypothrix sp. PCC 7601]